MMFFTIPLEIRQEIYTAYLTSISEKHLPLSTNNGHNRIHEENGCWRSEDLWWKQEDEEFLEFCVHYPNPIINPVMPSHSPLSLLLCNRQINAEVSALMEHLTSTSNDWMRYELDCEIVDEVKIFPTWVHIPPIHPRHGVTISCVHVTFRLSGQHRSPDPEGIGRVEYWSHGNGGPHGIIRGLEALLTRFLKWGPKFLNLSEKPQGSRIRYFRQEPKPTHKLCTVMVDKLVLNFATPPISPEELRLREDKGEIINPSEACAIVRRYFDILLAGGHRGDSSEKRDFVMARVGRVQWEIDGLIEQA